MVWESGCEAADWIDLAQDRNQRRAVVNTVMNLREVSWQADLVFVSE
jgi:hypothetical protein